jgi:hypothetical protein
VNASIADLDSWAEPTERKNLVHDPKYANDVTELRKMFDHMRRSEDPQTKVFEAAIAKSNR